jgi:cytochrome c554/c'-like protein
MAPGRATRAWGVLVASLALAAAWALDGRAADAPPLPGPAPRRHALPDAAAQNAACERCHADVAAEWRGSLHQLAQRDPFYQRAFALEPLAFCQSCHAPEADPTRPAPPRLAALGVGCVTCHVTAPGSVLAAPREGGREGQGARAAPHAVTRDARFAGEGACASCHEFRFPMVAAGAPRALMQSTVREHAASPNRDVACAGCHMPARGEGERRHKSHAFAGGRDASLVRSAATAAAARVGPAAVRVTITPSPALGHAFPTGDLFRRLEVSAEARDGGGKPLAVARRYLARRFADRRAPHGLGGVVRRELADERPLDAPVTVDLALEPSAAGRAVAWRVVYQRVDHPRSERPEDSVVGDAIVVAEGTLPP